MFNIAKYQKDIELLSTSVIIKLEAIALTMNKEINKTYDIVNQFDLEKSDWKYYKNLSGEYHETDNINYPDGLVITLIETRETVPLTKTVLENYSVTRNALINREQIYKSLVTKYPRAHLLILGIITPTDINVLVDLPNGTILGYNKSLIEYNEVSLLPSLELAIKHFVRRWILEDYALIDELNIATMLANIRNFIILKIHNHRLSKVMTGEVCKFHMSEYFKSNLNLGEYICFLNDKQQFWLYKHLRYLITNTGTTDVLAKLNDNILKPAGIVLKEYSVFIQEPQVITEQLGIYDQPDIEITPEVMREISNNYLNKIDMEELLIQGLIVTGSYENIYGPSLPQLSANLKEASKRPTINEQSKYIGISYGLDLSLKSTNLAEISIENWIDLAYNHNANFIVTFKDSNTNLIYELTPKESVLLMIKYILELVGEQNTPIESITLNNVLDKTVASLEIDLEVHDEMQPDYESQMTNIPVWGGGMSVEEVNEYISDVVNWYRLYWVSTVNDHMAVHTYLKGIMLDRIRGPITVELSNTPKVIDELLLESEISIIIEDGYDYTLALTNLIYACTGVNIDELTEKRNLISAYTNIVKRLTSYTLLILKEDVVKTESLPAIGTELIRELDGSRIYDGTSKCLEFGYGTIYAEVDDDSDFLLNVHKPMTHITKTTQVTGGEAIFMESPDDLRDGSITTLRCEVCLEK